MPLDIIIPVYNEGENIVKVLEVLSSSVSTPSRILICYDHDEDNTLEALKGYRGGRFEILPVKNQGQGVHGAILTGFRTSTAPAVLVFPADDTYNAGIIDKMYRLFEEGSDIVAASRFMPGGCMKGCRWLKAFLVRTSAFTLHHLARIPTHDPTSGFKLFSRRVLDEIPVESSQGFAFGIEFVVKSHRLGWKISEVPAVWFERAQGKSRFRVFKWIPTYLRWYFYAFATTYRGRSPQSTSILSSKS